MFRARRPYLPTVRRLSPEIRTLFSSLFRVVPFLTENRIGDRTINERRAISIYNIAIKVPKYIGRVRRCSTVSLLRYNNVRRRAYVFLFLIFRHEIDE